MFRRRLLGAAGYAGKVPPEFNRGTAKRTDRQNGGNQHELDNDENLRRLPVLHQWHIMTSALTSCRAGGVSK